jgi:hypothetical protein
VEKVKLWEVEKGKGWDIDCLVVIEQSVYTALGQNFDKLCFMYI